MKNNNLENNIWKIAASNAFRQLALNGAVYILFFNYLGFNFNDIGLIEAITSLAILIVELPSGIFADRVGRKWAVVVSRIFWLIYLLVQSYCDGSYLILVVIGLTSGLEYGFQSGASSALLYDTMKELGREDDFTRVNGRIKAIITILGIGAMIIGAYLFSINPRLPYRILSVSTVISILFMLSVEETVKPSDKIDFWHQVDEMKNSVRTVFKNRSLLWLSIFFFVPAVLDESYWDVYSQAHLTQAGLDPVFIGGVFAVFSVIKAITSYYVNEIEKKLGYSGSLYAIVVSNAVIFLILGYVSSWKTLMIVLVFSTVSRNFLWLVEETYKNRVIPSESRASILSAISFLNNGLFGGALIIWGYGWAIDNLSTHSTFLLSGALICILGLLIRRKFLH